MPERPTVQLKYDETEADPTVAYVDTGGPPVDTPLAGFLESQGLKVVPAKLVGCDTCGHIACVCAIMAAHEEGCRYRKAVTCAIGIECDCRLQRDVCPVCDACDCQPRRRGGFKGPDAA